MLQTHLTWMKPVRYFILSIPVFLVQGSPGGGGGALPYWRWRGRAAGQGMFSRSSILAQGSCGPLAAINISTGYLNRPNWLLSGQLHLSQGHFSGLPSPNFLWQGRDLGTSDGAILRQGMYMIFFKQSILWQGVYFVHRAHCDRVRFSTPSGTPPPPVHMKVECPPPPPPPPPGRVALSVLQILLFQGALFTFRYKVYIKQNNNESCDKKAIKYIKQI